MSLARKHSGLGASRTGWIWEEVFIGNFQVKYVRPGNSWDLKDYRQKSNEALRDYIKHFSRQCNQLTNLKDTDIIDAFISGTTDETLVHKLGQKNPRTAKEFFDIATNHASGEARWEPSSITASKRLYATRIQMRVSTTSSTQKGEEADDYEPMCWWLWQAR